MLPEGCHEGGVAHGAGLLAQDAQQAGGKERYAAVKTAQSSPGHEHGACGIHVCHDSSVGLGVCAWSKQRLHLFQS